MRVVRMGQVVFAVVLIALGVQGILKGDFVVPWQPVPQGVPARELLIYLSAGWVVAGSFAPPRSMPGRNDGGRRDAR